MEKLKSILENSKVRLGAVGLLGSAAILGGCAEAEMLPNRPALVVEHQYDDPDTRLVSVKPLMYAYDPERFLLVVEQCDRTEDEFADERGCVVDTVQVSENTYNQYPDGSSITFTE